MAFCRFPVFLHRNQERCNDDTNLFTPRQPRRAETLPPHPSVHAPFRPFGLCAAVSVPTLVVGPVQLLRYIGGDGQSVCFGLYHRDGLRTVCAGLQGRCRVARQADGRFAHRFESADAALGACLQLSVAPAGQFPEGGGAGRCLGRSVGLPDRGGGCRGHRFDHQSVPERQYAGRHGRPSVGHPAGRLGRLACGGAGHRSRQPAAGHDFCAVASRFAPLPSVGCARQGQAGADGPSAGQP